MSEEAEEDRGRDKRGNDDDAGIPNKLTFEFYMSVHTSMSNIREKLTLILHTQFFYYHAHVGVVLVSLFVLFSILTFIAVCSISSSDRGRSLWGFCEHVQAT